MGYIKVPKVYEKLKKAEDFFVPVIMTAATGWGKSAAVEYYYRRKAPVVLACRGGNITKMPSPESFRGHVVVIEDMQWLFEEESIRYLRGLLHTPGLQVVMLTRGGAVPKYLAAEDMDLRFMRIQERDFAFGENEVQAFFADRGIAILPEDAVQVAEASHGYVRAVHCYASRMEGGQRYSEEMKSAVWQDIYRLWDGQIYEQWTDEFIHFALCLCQYDSFTLEMAEYMTGNKKAGSVIEYCREQTSQLEIGDGSYRFRPETRGYYCWKQKLTWSQEEVSENYRRAANYFEMKDDIPNALKYYRKASATQRVKELLIRNAKNHPGAGRYVETKEYYFEIPREEILELPVLMAGMSMLCDLLLMPEQSEEWYRELEAFGKDKSKSRELRRDARTRLAYLDIALPHRGIRGILRIMKNSFALVQKGDIALLEFSVTGNMPSLMNGGLDFSEWSKNDTQIAKFMGKSLEVLLGKFGNGLVTIALAESGFEKGAMPAYEVLTRCSNGFEAAAHGGKIEMCFVSVGIQVRQHLVEGQLPSAKRVYDSFLEKAKAESADQLLPNAQAFGVWMSLFAGCGEQVEEYIHTVPDARVHFCILDRYRQMVKLRCLIAVNRLEEANDLAMFLTGYFVSYERHFYHMENELLKAIILYRMGDEHWKGLLRDALTETGEYHFVRIVSLEGAAVLPLLKQMREEGIFQGVDEEYIKQVYEECIRVASSYPDYLKYIPQETVALTKKEMQVLSLLCAGMSMEEICGVLDIGYDGLKKHNRSIYRKLGAKNRAEAERRAAKLGLVHRGESGYGGGIK